MQLISLKVIHNSIEIRNLAFKDGINIITNSGSEGNQIGKSTALRAINFCLGSDGKSIWIDPDTRTTNHEIEEFVTSGNVTFILDIKIKNITYVIKRKIQKQYQKSKAIDKIYSWINEEEINSHIKFKETIAGIFGHSVKKPTYSSVKNRFVRIDKSRANQLYSYLNQSTTKEEYIQIYSYLFGFGGHEELSQEIVQTKKKNDQEGRISILLNGKKEQYYKDYLKSIDDEIEILNINEESYDFKGVQTKAVAKLRSQRISISERSSTIANMETKAIYGKRTIENYNGKRTKIDVNLISSIYEEAITLVPKLSKSLEDTIKFHNSILNAKAEYVQENLNTLQINLEQEKLELSKLLDEEKRLIMDISNQSHLGGFIIIERELQEKREERGRASFILDEITEARGKIKAHNERIEKLRAKNESHMESLMDKVEEFNKESKYITRTLFKDFGLSLNVSCNSDGALVFSVVNHEKVMGDGAPRAASLAFDMAFVQYAKRTNSNLPQFTIQDYFEAADEDKLAKLAKIANQKKIQVIISILNDKLNVLDDDFKDANSILVLSPTDKFFKL